MHILYVIPRYGAQFTSNETHGELVRELQHLGVQVDILSFTTRANSSGPAGWNAGFGSERVYRHVQGGHLIERLLGPLARGLLHYEFFFAMLAGYLAIARRGYDIIHIEGTFPLGAIAALADRLVQRPVLITTTGGDLFRLPGQDYGYGNYVIPRQLIKLALRQATHVRANSTLSARLVAGYGTAPQRITVLPVSIADICFPPADQPLDAYRAACRATLSAQHGWNDRPLLVCVGRLMALKAQELLIEALPAIIARLGPVQACIIGPSRADSERGDYRDYLQRRANELGVAAYCTFTGYVPLAHVRDYLAAADLLVVPSRIEGLNRVVMEAGAVGTPAVVSDGAGAAELVVRYHSGLVTPTGSVPALAHAIVRLLASPRALSECRTQALTLGSDHAAPAVAARLVAIYRALERGT